MQCIMDIHIKCPSCKSVMAVVIDDTNDEEYLKCARMGCEYHEVKFKRPTIELEISEEGKDTLIERKITDKGW